MLDLNRSKNSKNIGSRDEESARDSMVSRKRKLSMHRYNHDDMGWWELIPFIVLAILIIIYITGLALVLRFYKQHQLKLSTVRAKLEQERHLQKSHAQKYEKLLATGEDGQLLGVQDSWSVKLNHMFTLSKQLEISSPAKANERSLKQINGSLKRPQTGYSQISKNSNGMEDSTENVSETNALALVKPQMHRKQKYTIDKDYNFKRKFNYNLSKAYRRKKICKKHFFTIINHSSKTLEKQLQILFKDYQYMRKGLYCFKDPKDKIFHFSTLPKCLAQCNAEDSCIAIQYSAECACKIKTECQYGEHASSGTNILTYRKQRIKKESYYDYNYWNSSWLYTAMKFLCSACN